MSTSHNFDQTKSYYGSATIMNNNNNSSYIQKHKKKKYDPALASKLRHKIEISKRSS